MSFNGQSLQDAFVLNVLKYKRNGYFLEVGSNHPININNSYVLEKSFGWTGLMVEFDAKFEPLYAKHRTSHYVIQDATTVDYAGLFSRYGFPAQMDYLQIDLEVNNRSTLSVLERLNETVFPNHTFATVTFEHDIYTGDHFNTRAASRKIFGDAGYVMVFGDIQNGGNKYEDWYVHPDAVDMDYIGRVKSEVSLDYTEAIKRVNAMLSIIHNIPDIHTYPLTYVFEKMCLQRKPDTLWLEFGVHSGRTVNYISRFTTDTVYGFDSFEGLPEKWRDGFDQGAFNRNGELPQVNSNVELVKGWFSDTLPAFIEQHRDAKVSFLHIDADLYSSAKFILDSLKHRLDTDCVVVFDELVNYPGFDGPTGELRAFYEFITENQVNYSWIGMDGTLGMTGYSHENVALIIHSVV